MITIKHLILALMLCASCAFSQTDKTVVAPTPPTTITELENFGQTILHSSGLAVGVYPSVMLGTLPAGSKATDRYGVGGVILYPVSEYAWVGLRLDYISGSFWAPSATLGARYTLKNLPMKPTFFTTGGLVYAVSGAGIDTHSVGAIAGLGVIGNIITSKDGRYSLDAFVEGEKWTNLPGEVLHFGLAGGIKF
jgi:hypothetical protein